MRKILKTSTQKWDESYSAGKWDYLEMNSLERARSAVIGMYCKHFSPAGKILDVGCGSGVLLDFLNDEHQKNYLGLDISKEAIRIAQDKRSGRFQIIDADLYDSTEKFDIIIFNETLYYLDYIHCLKKYSHFLNENGIIIVSIVRVKKLFSRFKFNRIWIACKRQFDIYEHIRLCGSGRENKLGWDIRVMRITALQNS